MKIALNILYLKPGSTGGTETYARALIFSLAALDRDNEYFIFCNREAAALDWPKQKNVRIVRCPIRSGDLADRYFWEQCVLPVQLRRLGIDVVHSLGYVAPLMSSVPGVVTIHDANHHQLRSDLGFIWSRVLGWFVKQSGKRSRKTLTVSNYARGEIHEHAGVPWDRIRVIRHGSDHMEDLPQAPWDSVSRALGIDKPFILSLGGIQRHKNASSVARAFARMKDRIPHQLVIAGHVERKEKAVIDALHLGSRLVETGYVPLQHLTSLFFNTDLFVLPSSYEGFGLPLLEAQRMGAPTAASRIGALTEVSGERSVFFDPSSIDEMVSAIFSVLQNPTLSSSLAREGREHAVQFTWLAAAEGTLKVYNDVYLESQSGEQTRVTARSANGGSLSPEQDRVVPPSSALNHVHDRGGEPVPTSSER